ncbi:DUF3800 domain-containing protein [Phenylobacterium ferrooxidans]|uniref:DUF3800 domain-containing protein n=1 Tax=Phenylobacterium ferrooxidans TaxID=2982689 RepID=A0ABW6CVH6_9CAUL
MANKFIFADEAGCFTFKDKPGASRFFILVTVASNNWTVSDRLLSIRRELALNGDPDRDKLHATTDLQEVRNVVFDAISKEDFRWDATILEKRKAQPQTRTDHPTFYRYAWYYHFKHVGRRYLADCDKMLITSAALGEKKTRAAFKAGVNEPVQQLAARERWEVAFHESCKDPLLWVADYCAWAVQKKWERDDLRSYDLIKRQRGSEYNLWSPGKVFYY